MLYVGVCGTDLHLLQHDEQTGYVQTSAPAYIPPLGRVIGHEGLGEVLAVGENVRNLTAGNLVAFASIIACMRCDICLRGAFNQCRNSKLLGMQADGLFGTIIDVPASIAFDVTHIVKTEQDMRALACAEPAAVALLACEKAKVSAGDRVTIFGGGPIGMYCAIMCKEILGASRVTLVEPVSIRRRLAERWCHCVYDIGEYFADSPRPTDVVIEASGDLSMISRVFPRIGPNGRVILLGRLGMPLVIDAVDHMITQAISIKGCRGHLGGAFARALALYHAGVLPLDAIITAEISSLDALFDQLKTPTTIATTQCKVVAQLGVPGGELAQR
jgi:threonine dehydrogenase-like Zn-dependent dehydrogenase